MNDSLGVPSLGGSGEFIAWKNSSSVGSLLNAMVCMGNSSVPPSSSVHHCSLCSRWSLGGRWPGG